MMKKLTKDQVLEIIRKDIKSSLSPKDRYTDRSERSLPFGHRKRAA